MVKRNLSEKIIYRVILWVLLVASFLVLLRLAPILTHGDYLPADDFTHYWASGRLNLQGINPFDPQIIQEILTELGGTLNWPPTTSTTLTPPWTIPLLMILGVFTYPVSRLIWLLISVIVILLSSLLFWRIYSGDQRFRWLALLVGFLFAPTISILEKGQLTNFMLLGLAGFLYFLVISRNDWLAGFCLAFMTIKPQVVLIFWLAVVIWVIQQRRWTILLYTALTIIGLTIIAMIFNPQILIQYFTMLKTYGISDWATPTIGAYLRLFLFGTEKFWLQFIPSFLAVVWLIYYWITHKRLWNWLHELPILLFVSTISSPYAWTYDQLILLPVFIQAAVWITVDQKRKSVIIFSVSYLALNLLNLLLHMKLDDFWFIWFAPAFLLWYLILRRQSASGQAFARLSATTFG